MTQGRQRRKWNRGMVRVRTNCKSYRGKTQNEEEKNLPKDIVILSDENMLSAKAIEDLRLPRVARAMSFRGNGWAKLSDEEVIMTISQMAKAEKRKLFIVLTRDREFIKDSRCKEQGIDIENSNLRIVSLSRKILQPNTREKKEK